MNVPVRVPRDTSYVVGYGKPPVKTRFPKGRSGNVLGRPKRRLPGLTDAITDELMTMVELKDGQKIPKLRVIIRTLILKAIQGNTRAIRQLVDLTEWMERSQREVTEKDYAMVESRKKLALLYKTALYVNQTGLDHEWRNAGFPLRTPDSAWWIEQDFILAVRRGELP